MKVQLQCVTEQTCFHYHRSNCHNLPCTQQCIVGIDEYCVSSVQDVPREDPGWGAPSAFHLPQTAEEPEVSEGWLYKRGKIVRSWKLRWFVLDTDRKEVITMH